jgi:hypothetical protein
MPRGMEEEAYRPPMSRDSRELLPFGMLIRCTVVDMRYEICRYIGMRYSHLGLSRNLCMKYS